MKVMIEIYLKVKIFILLKKFSMCYFRYDNKLSDLINKKYIISDKVPRKKTLCLKFGILTF